MTASPREYSKEQARNHISRLVQAFRRVEANLQAAQESQIENDYIRPLFRYLNWRTESAGLRISEHEIVLVETDPQGKRPDYRFQLNGQHLLFMDAKKIKYSMYDPRWQWQVYRYAYSTRNNPAPRKVDFGVLTDFQEFILLDCTFEAKEPAAVNNFRALSWRYPDYITQFDRLWDIFERNNMLAASRERKGGLWSCYLTPKQAKANRVPPDEGFLDKLDNDKTGWRVRLAKDMKRRTPDLTGDVITAAVQLLIDRLVFIKALSDRDIDRDYLADLAQCIEADGLEEHNHGWFAAAKPLLGRLNRFYNGSIFAPRPELEAVVTSNSVVRNIIRELDPDHSPYDLGVLPVEILGTIYERFLARVVRTTDQRAIIERKPEAQLRIRKAHGVYYTPQYIVGHIVEQTLGQLLAECKTPSDVAKLRVLDPACGSGSFLIGAYDALIEWHKTYYSAQARLNRRDAYRDARGDIRLTARLKREILLTSIFGVDIDQQAVEVTRFSLSLKALEDTRKDELDEERTLFKETVLPDLSQNIICGNSLIGTDILKSQEVDREQERKLNPMNYQDKFPDVMEQGGFNVVIGNPPYVLIQGAFRDDTQIAYFRSKYAVASYKVDTYHLFMERAIRLSRRGGRCAMITPANFLTNNYLTPLRRFLMEHTKIACILVIDGGVFRGVSVDNAISVLLAGERTTGTFPVVHAVPEDNGLREISRTLVSVTEATKNSNVLFTGGTPGKESALWQRVTDVSVPLETVAFVNFGKQLRDRKKFIRDVITVSNAKPLPKGYRPCFTGRDITRYCLQWGHLACMTSEVARRGGCWDADRQNAKDKLLTRQIGVVPEFAIDVRGYQCLNTAFMVNIFAEGYSPCFLLAVLNSKLLQRLWKDRFYDRRRTFPKIKGEYLKQLPICRIDLSRPEERRRHDQLVAIVTQMLAAKDARAGARTEGTQNYYASKCEALDKQIDGLVYQLYSLTPAEIAIVESEQ